MEIKLVYLVFVILRVNGTISKNFQGFKRVLKVGQQDLSLYTLDSHTEIQSVVTCALLCEAEACLSFSYKGDVDKRCDTFSRIIVEDKNAHISVTINYYAKDMVMGCTDVQFGSPSGVYQLTKVDGEKFEMYCDMETDDGPWGVIQRRQSGDVDFYRNWTEYKNGFGDIHGEFWIGNDNLHRLTNTSKSLRIELETWDGITGYAQYATFKVEGEDKNYRLFIQGFSSNLSLDVMDYYNHGTEFSTFDKDNDWLSNENCAVTGHGAWWYKACTATNLNGRHQSDNGDDMASIYWMNFPVGRRYCPLKKSLMLIQ